MMASLIDRMVRASKLDINLYEEVEADKSSMGQAITVVVISSVASGIGTIGILGIQGLIVGTISALIGWLVWAYLTYLIGTKLLPEPQTKADVGELLRTIGFSSAPGVLLKIPKDIYCVGAVSLWKRNSRKVLPNSKNRLNWIQITSKFTLIWLVPILP